VETAKRLSELEPRYFENRTPPQKQNPKYKRKNFIFIRVFELDLEPDFELARGDSEAPLRT
jgi:hypothetical protein